MTLLISSIALISLIVGGIGVMNIMLVSVTERTREIGVRMAIGAKSFNILEQFLIEAISLCVMGGLAGIALSGIIGLLFNNVTTDFYMSFAPSSIILALACSSLIGVLFGFLPARNAAKLNPIDALAYE
jgi:macrolide transport system ATP-binding/permease protein